MNKIQLNVVLQNSIKIADKLRSWNSFGLQLGWMFSFFMVAPDLYYVMVSIYDYKIYMPEIMHVILTV